MRPSVRLIETISPKEGQDAIVLSELLKMAGWASSRHEITGKTKKQQKEWFLNKLLLGKDRFIHISAHGSADGGLIVGDKSVEVSGKDIAEYCKAKTSDSKPLKGRFVTLSACGEISGRLPLDLNEAAGVTGVISPLVEVGFAETAVFMVLFYFALAKYPKLSDFSSSSDKAQTRTSRRIAHYIDSFQKAKLAYLGIGGTGAFRLNYWWEDEHVCLH